MGSGGGCGLWVAVKVAGILDLLVVLKNLHIREGEIDKVRCGRNNKKLIKK